MSSEHIPYLLFAIPLLSLLAFKKELRTKAVILPLLLSFFVLSALLNYSVSSERAVERSNFERVAKDFSYSVSSRLAERLNFLDAIESYYQASTHVDREEFGIYVAETLKRFPSIQTILWIPTVAEDGRAEFQRKAEIESDGLFAKGAAVDPGTAEHYYPIYYVEPQVGHTHLIGRNLGVTPEIASALRRSATSLEETSVFPVKFLRKDVLQAGLLLAHPISSVVSEKQLIGFVAVVFRRHDLVQGVLSGLSSESLDVEIFDVDASGNKDLIYIDSEGGHKGERPLVMSLELPLNDRSWEIDLWPRSPAGIFERAGSLAISIGGFLLQCLLMAFVVSLANRDAKANEIVEQKTAELENANELLQIEIASGKTFQAELDEQRLVALVSATEANHAEVRAREQALRFEAVIDSSPAGVLGLGGTGEILLSNTELEKIFQIGKEEILGRDAAEFLSLSEEERSNFRSLDGTERWLERADFSRVLVEISICEVPRSEEITSLVVLSDITERRFSENQLISTGRIIEEDRNEIYFFRSSDFRFLYVNKGGRENLGYSAEELLELTLIDITSDYTEETFLSLVEPVMDGRDDGLTFETSHIRKDGSHYFVESHLQRSYYQGEEILAAIVIDVTERKKHLDEIAQRERELKLIFDSVPSRIWYKDDQNKILRLNRAAAEAMGGEVKDFEGQNTYDLFPEMAKKYHDDDLAVIHSKQPLLGIVEQFVPRDAPSGWVSTDKIPSFDPKTDSATLLVVSSDITDRMRAEEELRRSNKELDQFAYIASHDLKAPLRAIRNYAQWVIEDGTGQYSEEVRGYLDKMQERVGGMERLLDDLLGYARAGREQGLLVELDTKELVTDVVTLLTPPEGFDIRVPAQMPTIQSPRAPLELVFRNLISNAITYCNREDAKIEIDAKPNGMFVHFSVADNGPGIAPQYHEKIFRMFQSLQIKEEAGSSGMGLALVKKVVEQRGGSVSIESAEGKGAVFNFSWPKYSEN